MEPLDKGSAPHRREAPGQHDGPTKGKTGRGAASALEHFIRQEKSRLLHNPGEPPPERPPSVDRAYEG